MTLPNRREPRLLDREAWDAPDHLTDDDLRAAAGPDWRRTVPNFEDLEDEL